MESYLEILQQESSVVQRNELFQMLVMQLDKDLYTGTGGRVSLNSPEQITLNSIQPALKASLKLVLKLPGTALADYLYRVDVLPNQGAESLEDMVMAVLNRTTQKVVFRKRFKQ